MTEFFFEEITGRDFDEIYQIEREAYPIPWSEKIMRSMVSGNDYKIKLLSCDKIIAYAFVMIVLDEATILNITVAPNAQGKGVGKRLLEWIKCQLMTKHISTIFLEVRESNVNALCLYHSSSFNEIDVRKNYYPATNGREDAIIMACFLEN